jgi:hypothetical protein
VVKQAQTRRSYDMGLCIDHLVIAARTLEEGASWVESRLGATPGGGGKHALMGTHNRLLGLGGNCYLEVIAVDPQAPAPARTRWYALDAPAMRARLQRGPALIHWVANTLDIEGAVANVPVDLGEIVSVSRGDYRWRITVPRDGSLPAAGVFPTLIEWDGPRPAASLPDSGCRLESLDLGHPRATAIYDSLRALGMAEGEPVELADAEPAIIARIRTPGGMAVLA